MLDNGENGSSALFYDVESVKAGILSKKPEVLANDAGVEFNGHEFLFESLGQKIKVSYPSCNVTFAETNELPRLIWRLNILHYLNKADGVPLTGELVAFKDLEKHVAHPQVFESDIISEIEKNFVDKPINTLEQICVQLGGRILKTSADLAAVFDYLPKFPITLKIWLSDEELKGTGKILFEKRGCHYLPIEDVNFTGPMFISFLVKSLL